MNQRNRLRIVQDNKNPLSRGRDNGGDGGDNGGMEARVAKLEAAVEHIQRDITDIRSDLRDIRGELRGIHGAMRTQLYWILGIFAAGLGVLAKGFGWI